MGRKQYLHCKSTMPRDQMCAACRQALEDYERRYYETVTLPKRAKLRDKAKRARCVCLLPDCPGQGKPWFARGKKPPSKCRFCHRLTWNREDRRKKGTENG